jgi:hypothetical protein
MTRENLSDEEREAIIAKTLKTAGDKRLKDYRHRDFAKELIGAIIDKELGLPNAGEPLDNQIYRLKTEIYDDSDYEQRSAKAVLGKLHTAVQTNLSTHLKHPASEPRWINVGNNAAITDVQQQVLEQALGEKNANPQIAHAQAQLAIRVIELAQAEKMARATNQEMQHTENDLPWTHRVTKLATSPQEKIKSATFGVNTSRKILTNAYLASGLPEAKAKEHAEADHKALSTAYQEIVMKGRDGKEATPLQAVAETTGAKVFVSTVMKPKTGSDVPNR